MLYDICRGHHCGGDTLQSCGISERVTVNFFLSTFSDETTYEETFFINDCVPSVQQTQKGISVLLSSLYALVSCMFILHHLYSICLTATTLPVSALKSIELHFCSSRKKVVLESNRRNWLPTYENWPDATLSPKVCISYSVGMKSSPGIRRYTIWTLVILPLKYPKHCPLWNGCSHVLHCIFRMGSFCN